MITDASRQMGRQTVSPLTPLALRTGVSRRRAAVWLTCSWVALLWLMVFLDIRDLIFDSWARIFAIGTLIAMATLGALVARPALTARGCQEFAFALPISPTRLLWLEWGGAMLALAAALAVVTGLLFLPVWLIAAQRGIEHPLDPVGVLHGYAIHFALLSAWASLSTLMSQTGFSGVAVFVLGSTLWFGLAQSSNVALSIACAVAIAAVAPLAVAEVARLTWRRNLEVTGEPSSPGEVQMRV